MRTPRVRSRPKIPTQERTHPNVKTFLLTLRQFNQLETRPPKVVGVHFLPGKGWVVEMEDRRFNNERRSKQLGVIKKGVIHMSSAEFQSLNAPHPTGFLEKSLFHVNFDERRKRTRRRLPRSIVEKDEKKVS